jgi:four helix bundle protein
MKHSNPPTDDINERALAFACRVISPFVASLSERAGHRRIADQLVGAAGGIGSNLEEARAASSRREFVRFNEIALRESRESAFWLSICRRTTLGDQIVCEELLDEARQLVRIIAAIVVSTKRNGL